MPNINFNLQHNETFQQSIARTVERFASTQTVNHQCFHRGKVREERGKRAPCERARSRVGSQSRLISTRELLTPSSHLIRALELAAPLCGGWIQKLG